MSIKRGLEAEKLKAVHIITIIRNVLQNYMYTWTDKVTNQHVLQKINIKSTELVQMIRTRKAKFYGHVRRHDSLQRVILEGKVEGKRGRGRKRTSWTDNIKTHLGLPINTCAELALDRKKWRAMTPNLGSEKEPG